MVKMIKISDEIHKELDSLGVRNETFESIIKRLLDFYRTRTAKQ